MHHWFGGMDAPATVDGIKSTSVVLLALMAGIRVRVKSGGCVSGTSVKDCRSWTAVSVPKAAYFRDIILGLEQFLHGDLKWCHVHSNNKQW